MKRALESNMSSSSSSSSEDTIDRLEPPVTRAAACAAAALAPCYLVDTLLTELRPALYLALALDCRDLARLARTCKSFYTDVVKKQTGPLYLPPAWRRTVAARLAWPSIFRSPFRTVVKDLYSAQFFTGLDGAASKFRLSLENGARGWPREDYVFIELATAPKSAPGRQVLRWKFVRMPGGSFYTNGYLCSERPVLDAAARLEWREKLLEVHEHTKRKARHRHSVPPELRQALSHAKDRRHEVNTEIHAKVRSLRLMPTSGLIDASWYDCLVGLGQLASAARDLDMRVGLLQIEVDEWRQKKEKEEEERQEEDN